jgi:broad specificity phosphatase PhoE
VLIMGAIYLVRHGQGAFGTDDYDRLTEIARRRHSDGNVLIVSSGGPIAAIVAAALESTPQLRSS